MIRSIIGTFLLVFAAPTAQGQADSILALPKELQVRAIWQWYSPAASSDTTYQINRFKKLEREFREKGEKLLEQQSWLVLVEYNSRYRHTYSDKSIQIITKAIEEARDRNWKLIEAECVLRKGLLYYDLRQWGPAFEYMHRGYEMLKSLDFSKSPHTLRYLVNIGKTYFEFGNYEEAIQYLRQALDTPQEWFGEQSKARIWNTLALSFQKIQAYDSAIHYYKLAHDQSIKANDTFWAALTNGNLGYVYYKQGRYDEAIPLMEIDYTESIRIREYGSAVNAALSLSNIYLKKRKPDKAGSYLEFARKYINRANIYELPGFYKNLSEISRYKGDYIQAFAYQDSFQLFKDSVAAINDSKIIEQAKLNVQVEKHAGQILLLDLVRKRQILFRNGLILILLLTGAIVLLLLNQKLQRRKKENQLTLLHQKIAEDELSGARRELENFTNAIKEKNELIDSFKKEIDNLKASGARTSDEARFEQITELVHSTILTEEDWKKFRQLFDKVYPGFILRMKEKIPDLTPAEVRLLSLSKLQLTPTEMASMLGISYDAIKKTRQRFQKKLGLSEETTLESLMEAT